MYTATTSIKNEVIILPLQGISVSSKSRTMFTSVMELLLSCVRLLSGHLKTCSHIFLLFLSVCVCVWDSVPLSIGYPQQSPTAPPCCQHWNYNFPFTISLYIDKMYEYALSAWECRILGVCHYFKVQSVIQIQAKCTAKRQITGLQDTLANWETEES